MNIKTEKNGIINIDHYPGIGVRGKDYGTAYLCAFTVLKPKEIFVTGELIIIAEYDQKVDADYAYLKLSDVLSNTSRPPMRDPNSIEKISDLWDKVMTEIDEKDGCAYSDLARHISLNITELY